MSFGTIASAAISFIAPILAKGGEELAKGAGKDLWELIKKPFQKKDHHKEALKELEQKPEDPVVQARMASKLEDHLAEDEAFRAELEALMKQLDVPMKTNTQTITGTGNIGIQDVQNSQININK